MDNLGAMRLLIDIVKTGSFSETARHFGLAPSSVTRQMNALEEMLGVRLLTRTTRHVSLTEAGRIYHERAKVAVADIDDMNRAVAELDATPRGVLRVSAPVVLGRVQLAPYLSRFLSQYPDVSVELSLSDQLVDLVQEGMDLAIRVASRLPDSTLISRRIHTVQRVICASPCYLEKRGVPAKPTDLIDHECLTFRVQGNSELWGIGARNWRFCQNGAVQDVAVSGRLESNNGDVLVEAALSGLGLVHLPRWIVGEYIEQGKLVEVLGDYEIGPYITDSNIFLVYPSNRYLSPKVRAFADFAAELFKSNQNYQERRG
ncbi:LysR family transcriptional regulator [Sneathiella chinensis]|uniref:LysR family transcriptional regulator n=1 Tax=Sneathiella chinensis TaxID=349750 RepID=A0ABQ5TZM6_9PROT|nr:LysR family transcriptional regulator [Sneathiella chinensis]GLQ05018.1 LysR family transcriptional regulator [Sneathiella chinensis]